MLRRLIVLSLLLLAGCAQNPAGLPLWQAKEVAPPSLQYLGVAGYLLRWQGEALLFAPSFSNPASSSRDNKAIRRSMGGSPSISRAG